MMAKLKRGLMEQEIQYYNLIAASKKGGPLAESDKLKTVHVMTAYGVFEQKVDGIMTSSGSKP